jgi:hypothetical protein
MDGRGSMRLPQHSLAAGDLAVARLAFSFGRAAQGVGSSSEGTSPLLQCAQCQPGVHFRSSGQPGLFSESVTFSGIRVDLIRSLSG